MANQNIKLKSTELFEELSEEDLTQVVGGVDVNFESQADPIGQVDAVAEADDEQVISILPINKGLANSAGRAFSNSAQQALAASDTKGVRTPKLI